MAETTAAMVDAGNADVAALLKFVDPARTVDGKQRARVRLRRLKTLWFNTGTLCNLACENCYIESSPRNDRLVYLSRAEALDYLREAAALHLGTEEIGFTGGEPFMNPDLAGMLADALEAGYRALVLTNAMRPMMKRADDLLRLRRRYGERLVLRVSVDHFRPELPRRGARSPLLGANACRLALAERQRLCRARRRAAALGRRRRCDAPRLSGAVRGRGRGGGRRLASGPGAVPGDGHGRRHARNHHRLLGNAGRAPGRRHVRLRRAWW